MLAWPHSGFHVHHHVRIEAGDENGRAQLARYAARCPVALSRMTYDAEKAVVTIVSDKSDGPTAGTHTFEPLEFLARLLAHVPRKSEIYVRYCGAYSVRRRAASLGGAVAQSVGRRRLHLSHLRRVDGHPRLHLGSRRHRRDAPAAPRERPRSASRALGDEGSASIHSSLTVALHPCPAPRRRRTSHPRAIVHPR